MYEDTQGLTDVYEDTEGSTQQTASYQDGSAATTPHSVRVIICLIFPLFSLRF